MERHLRLAVPPPTPREPREWTDSDLVDALLAGDPRAAEPLHDRLRPAIDRALRRVLHHRPRDFEDLVQVTFERVLEGLANGRFERRSQLTTWAAAIASHVALDALRADHRDRSRRLDVTDWESLASAGRPESRMEAQAELRYVQSVLSRMKPDLAQVLVLHDVLGHNLEEVAALAGATLSATQSRLLRGRKELERRTSSLRPRVQAPGSPTPDTADAQPSGRRPS